MKKLMCAGLSLMNGTVHVNQIGYRSGSIKRLVCTGLAGPSPFWIVEEQAGAAVYEGVTGEPRLDEASGDRVCWGEFTGVTAPGRYYAVVEGAGRSPAFSIGAEPYQELHAALLKSFYYQRCGMELEEAYAGSWKHKACHTEEGSVYGEPGVRLPSFGGWHDAGDYGKYTVAAAKAVADLLLAWELYPEAFQAALPIPESGNRLPDILNEVRWELDWLLRMQRKDGSVFHKLTTYHFPGLAVMPEEDRGELVFSPVSTAAAGSFAAVTAQAARLYAAYDAGFAGRCLAASREAWSWLQENPSQTGFRNPPEMTTGEYGDETWSDEMYWAAAELFRTTGEGSYHEEFLNLLQSGGFPLYSLGWADVGGYGTLAYLMMDPASTNPGHRETLLQGWTQEGERLCSLGQADGYGVSMKPEQYIWGSNMLVLNHAMHLLLAARFSVEQSSRYISAAEDQAHYLLGRNTLGICYVTGFGAKSVKHPHHRPSVGDGVAEPVPGMVAGGPNQGLQDEAAKQQLAGQPPARCFIDHEDSYSTNEMTIYWNSPAVFVFAGLS